MNHERQKGPEERSGGLGRATRQLEQAAFLVDLLGTLRVESCSRLGAASSMDELRDIPKSVRVLPCPPTAMRKFGSVSSVGLASGSS